MKAAKLLKILAFSFVLALGLRLAGMGTEALRQNNLTKDLCGLVSLPLETALLRDTYEGLESALRAHGESSACVSVTDNGRSYSPDCIQQFRSYRTVACKAAGNTGVRAAISFETHGPFDLPLLLLWITLSFLALGLLSLSRALAGYVVSVFSGEVTALLQPSIDAPIARPTLLTRIAQFVLRRLGISARLSAQAETFRNQLKLFQESIASEAVARTRLEQESIRSKEYVDKVKQIRHDIRSPLSSLQAIYEKVSAADAGTTKALATAIRRIQILVDDLNQVDRVRETATLVIAEVAIEEIILSMMDKFKEAKSARLTVTYSGESLSPVMVGAKEFNSAVENLLENALEAITIGGRVSVRVTTSGRLCKIEFEDDGCGIPKDVLSKLFTHGGSFGKINGLGLGLFHTKANIESWGGKIECVQLSRGTQFLISLPLMQTGVVFTGLPHNRKIKVIDDDREISKILNRTGYQILECALTFSEGERVLARGTADDFSILVDQRIGTDQFGTDLIAGQPGRKNVFLCTNDYDDLGLIKRAREIGVKVIPKPMCYFGAHRTLNEKKESHGKVADT